MTQGFEITPRKRPTQARAQATFDALVEACARLLPEFGYERLTTNAISERAGVGIGSLYEYFPSKDAIIAQVVERLVERVMTRLGEELATILAARSGRLPEDEVERWIERIYATIERERALVAVLVQQVPYLRQLESVRDLPATLLAFSERARSAAGVELKQPSAALLLINNLVATTIMQVVLGPDEGAPRLPGMALDGAHGGVTKAELIEMLGAHVSELLAAGAASPRQPT
jgi:AcrR family transcriptional regulator